MLVLKDLGLSQILKRNERPAVLTNQDFFETLFSILFAPSCPVICDPTGEVESYIKEKFLSNFGVEKISAANILGNGKLKNCLSSNRAAIVTDVNFHRKINAGLSIGQPLFKRLSETIYNGFDFNDKRTAALKKANVLDYFFTFYTGQNKRIQTFGNKFENVSIFQAMIFQPGFEHATNTDFNQNATYVCGTPTNLHNNRMIEENVAMINLKEFLLRNLHPGQLKNFESIKEQLSECHQRIPLYAKDFENAFLVASSQTLKNLSEYGALQTAL